MANDVLTNQASAYDGSPSGSNDVFPATGPIRLTVSGKLDGATLWIFSRTNSNTGYVGYQIPVQDGRRPRVALLNGDSYYYALQNVGSGTSVSLTDESE